MCVFGPPRSSIPCPVAHTNFIQRAVGVRSRARVFVVAGSNRAHALSVLPQRKALILLHFCLFFRMDFFALGVLFACL